MKILSISASNFGSYKQLQFNFDEQGLCLIQGSTGSGKSTLCDLVPWAIFGRTAKDGAADDVRTWNTESPTVCVIFLQVQENVYMITRKRAPNDLSFCSLDQVQHRGKDLNDTQKQINQLLGMTYETYMAGSYFHEFSKTASFFTTTAKNRRDICEQLVDLSMAKNLQTKASELIKEKAKLTNDASALYYKEQTKLNYAIQMSNAFKQKQANFEVDKQRNIEHITKSIERFDLQTKFRIKELRDLCATMDKSMVVLQDKLDAKLAKLTDETCEHCGAAIDNDEQNECLELTTDLVYREKMIRQQSAEIQKLMNTPNPHKETLVREENRINTYQKDIDKALKDENDAIKSMAELNGVLDQTKSAASDCILLQDIIQTFRATIITDTMSFIQDKTNSLLSDYFDGELKVIFDVNQADKLDVTIYKDGNECNFTQLSKGQRQLLKLTFGIAVMQAVVNHSGVKFNCLFMDEALSGLDDSIKIKAFRMFESLAIDYESIFVIDHNNDFKSLFSKKYTVSLLNGESQINEEV